MADDAKKRRRKKKQEPGTALVHVPKVPQPHGGSIHAGGVPGNRGGGRTPKALKQLARDVLNRRQLIERLGEIGSGELIIQRILTKNGLLDLAMTPSVKEQVMAIAELGKMGDVLREESVSPEDAKKGIRVFVLAENAVVS